MCFSIMLKRTLKENLFQTPSSFPKVPDMSGPTKKKEKKRTSATCKKPDDLRIKTVVTEHTHGG